MGTESIAFNVVTPAMPVDAIHELAPSDDLAHETFGRGQRDLSLPEGRHGRLDALHRMQQPEVQHRCQHRVEQHRFTRHHQIFIRTKLPETIGDKCLQPAQRIGPGHRKPEARRIPGMIREQAANLIDHRARDRIGFHPGKRGRTRFPCARPLRPRPTILGIEVPFTAGGGSVRFHQDPELPPHPPVMVLEQQAPRVASPFAELPAGNEEQVRRDPLQFHAHLPGRGGKGIGGRPVTSLHDADPIRPESFDVGLERGGEVRRVREEMVVDLPTGGFQLVAEVPHGGIHQHQLLLVVTLVPAAGPRFDHQDHGGARIAAGQGRVPKA